MALIPAGFAGLEWQQIKQAGSLDFALRILSNDLDLSRWILREERTIAGGDGRTFTESRMWNDQGKMIAHMSQQGFLRGTKPKL
jgi:acyl-CoA thioesterase